MTRRDWIWATALTVLFEVATCISRFGMGLQSTRDTGFIAPFTYGIRIHHGYVGALLVLAATLLNARRLRPWLFRFGVALIASDLIHHFAVLWPITGDPQFDLTYPDP